MFQFIIIPRILCEMYISFKQDLYVNNKLKYYNNNNNNNNNNNRVANRFSKAYVLYFSVKE